MRVLVCGGRDWRGRAAVFRMLTQVHATAVIHGGARGADSLAGDWARENNVLEIIEHADWDRLGPGAGPMRNQKMLDDHKPDLVLAFPGGRGTADMVRRSEKAGVKVIHHTVSEKEQRP